MRRLASIVLALAAACGELSQAESGSTRTFYKPTGVGVYGGRLVVASSNGDLRYEGETGGSVIVVDPLAQPGRPDLATWMGGLNVGSFSAGLAIADPVDCGLPAPLALVPLRGSDVLYRIALDPATGAPSCDGCALPLRGNEFTDPFSVAVACADGGAFARAYVGYLRSVGGRAWLTQVDLTATDPTADGAVQHGARGLGQLRAFAFDRVRKRLYAAQSATSGSTVIRWYDLVNGCRIDVAELDGGCRGGVAALPPGLEPEGIALASGDPRRMYIAVRIFDVRAAAVAGVRVGDMDGLLLVANLVDDVAGQTHVEIEKQISVGYGVTALAVLPPRASPRDAVAVLAADDGVLWLYDDETDALAAVGRYTKPSPDPTAPDPSGHSRVGATPFGLAVDPIVRSGTARVYVGSYEENFVTAIDVPVLDVNGWSIPQAGTPPLDLHINGGTP